MGLYRRKTEEVIVRTFHDPSSTVEVEIGNSYSPTLLLRVHSFSLQDTMILTRDFTTPQSFTWLRSSNYGLEADLPRTELEAYIDALQPDALRELEIKHENQSYLCLDFHRYTINSAATYADSDAPLVRKTLSNPPLPHPLTNTPPSLSSSANPSASTSPNPSHSNIPSASSPPPPTTSP